MQVKINGAFLKFTLFSCGTNVSLSFLSLLTLFKTEETQGVSTGIYIHF